MILKQNYESKVSIQDCVSPATKTWADQTLSDWAAGSRTALLSWRGAWPQGAWPGGLVLGPPHSPAVSLFALNHFFFH